MILRINKIAYNAIESLKIDADVTIEDITHALDGGEFAVICEKGVMVLTFEAENLLEEWEFENVEKRLEDARRMANSVDIWEARLAYGTMNKSPRTSAGRNEVTGRAVRL